VDCPACKAEISEGKKFCGRCGAGVAAPATSSPAGDVMMTACPRCNHKVSPAQAFCGGCGASLRQPDSKPRDPLPTDVIPAASRLATAVQLEEVPLTYSAPALVVNPTASPVEQEIVPALAPSPSIPAIITDSEAVLSLPGSSSARPIKSLLAILGAGLLLIMVLGAILWYRDGVELDLITNPTEAEVLLDGKPMGVTGKQAGVLLIPHLSRGTYTLTVVHEGYQAWSEPVSLGWFEQNHLLRVKLHR